MDAIPRYYRVISTGKGGAITKKPVKRDGVEFFFEAGSG
jgi:hypothetical protein